MIEQDLVGTNVAEPPFLVARIDQMPEIADVHPDLITRLRAVLALQPVP